MADTTTIVTTGSWGIAPDGSAVQSFSLQNDILRLEVMSHGARVVSLQAPGRDGTLADIVLGYAALAPYLEDKAFLGCTVGRYANRIAGGRFTLNGITYELDRNDGENTLHGGSDGMWHRNWSAATLPDGVEFTLTSAAGEGFPGTLRGLARLRLIGNQVSIEYEATTDAPTVVNLTNHTYFNLAGEGVPTILDHELQIEADAFTAISDTAIPLGPQQPVAGSAFDFTTPHTVGERIYADEQQLLNGRGYDHNFVLRGSLGELHRAAVAFHPGSGRRLEVATTEPGVQFYSGNYLDASTLGKSGSPYGFRSGFCLETQHFPDSPNHPEYPSAELHPGEVFRSATVWTVTGG